MAWKRKAEPECQRCGDEGAELCPTCLRFLCDGCLDRHEHIWRNSGSNQGRPAQMVPEHQG